MALHNFNGTQELHGRGIPQLKIDLDTKKELLKIDYYDFFRYDNPKDLIFIINDECSTLLADYLNSLAEYAKIAKDMHAFIEYFYLVNLWFQFSTTHKFFYDSKVYYSLLTVISDNLLLTDDNFISLVTSEVNLKILLIYVHFNENSCASNPKHIELRDFLLQTLRTSLSATYTLIKQAQEFYPNSGLDTFAKEITIGTPPDNQDDFAHKYIRRGSYKQHQVIFGTLGDETKLDAYREKIDLFKTKGHQALLLDTTNSTVLLDTIQSKLDTKFPHFSEITQTLCASIAILMCSKEPRQLHFKPTLLAGAPGMGKTTYLQYFSTLLTLPFYRIDVASMTNGFVLNGSDTTWSSGKPGKIAKHLIVDYGISNPIFLFDEVDKAARDPRGNIEDSLLPLLEENTAKEFSDEFFNGLRLDVSGFSFFATANDTTVMSDTLLNRFNILLVREPTNAEMMALVQQIYTDLLDKNQVSHIFEASLPLDFIVAVTQNCNNSLREINRYLTLLISQAAMHYITLRIGTPLNSERISLSQHSIKKNRIKKNPIGFSY